MSQLTPVDQYLAALPPDRRTALAEIRNVINSRLPRGFQETLQYNLISWIVPPARLAATYNGQPLALACLGSQKQHMALYLMSVYGSSELAAWFRDAYLATGKKLDMGKSCIRFKTLDALALDVVGEAIARVSVDAYVANYEAQRSQAVEPKRVAAPAGHAAAKRTAKRAVAKRAAPKRAVAKRAAPKRARGSAK